MNALITGGLGFIGTAVVRELQRTGARVTIADRADFGVAPSLEPTIASGAVELVTTDLSTPSALHDRIARGEFDLVLHLASLHFIPACESRPVDAYRDNVVAAMSLLSVCPAGSRFVNVSTAAVYRPDDAPHTEMSAVGPTDVYGWTKKHAEDLATYYAHSRRLSVLNIRLFNAVGPGETNPHILPSVLKQVESGTTVLELGNTFPKRDFIHIEDIAWTLRRLSSAWPVDTGAIATLNLGSGIAISIDELVRRIGDVSGRALIVRDTPARRRDVERPMLCADISRLKTVLPDFQPQTVDQWLPALVRDPAFRAPVHGLPELKPY